MVRKVVSNSSSNRPSRHPAVAAVTAETLPLDGPNWLLIKEAHSRLCPLIGNPRLVDYDLTVVFAALSRTPYVRTLRRWHRRPGRARINDPRLWAIKFELDSSWSGGLHVARRVHGATPRIRARWSALLGGYDFYAWLPDLAEVWSSLFAPASARPLQVELVGTPKVQLVENPTSQTQAKVPPRELTAKEWITLEAQRLKRLEEIPVGIKKTDFAKMLETNMEEANRTDHSISISPVGWPYIRNHLKEWGLWPISAIE